VVRQVETQVTPQLGELLLAHVAGLAHERGERVARHHPHQPEHDQRRQHEDGDREQQPA
jgi:hypothetical protein